MSGTLQFRGEDPGRLYAPSVRFGNCFSVTVSVRTVAWCNGGSREGGSGGVERLFGRVHECVACTQAGMCRDEMSVTSDCRQ